MGNGLSHRSTSQPSSSSPLTEAPRSEHDISFIGSHYLNQDLVTASGSYSQDNGAINGAPRLLSTDNFSIWKHRMISFLNFIDNELVGTIKEGRHTPLNERSKWSDEDKRKVALDYKAMHILSASLPDDIYRFVMYTESAKDMWDTLVVLFEDGPDRVGLVDPNYTFINGYKNALAIAVETNYSFLLADKVKEYLADPSKFDVAAPVEEKKEEVFEESDDDMGFSLFD